MASKKFEEIMANNPVINWFVKKFEENRAYNVVADKILNSYYSLANEIEKYCESNELARIFGRGTHRSKQGAIFGFGYAVVSCPYECNIGNSKASREARLGRLSQYISPRWSIKSTLKWLGKPDLGWENKTDEPKYEIGYWIEDQRFYKRLVSEIMNAHENVRIGSRYDISGPNFSGYVDRDYFKIDVDRKGVKTHLRGVIDIKDDKLVLISAESPSNRHIEEKLSPKRTNIDEKPNISMKRKMAMEACLKGLC